MALLTVPDENTFVSFDVTSAEDEFPITFALWAKADLWVTVDGVALDQSDFTFTGTLLDGGGYDGGTVTLNDPVENVTVRIWRDIAVTRTSNFSPASSVPVRAMDAALNRLTMHVQDARYGLVSEAGVRAAADTALQTSIDVLQGILGGDDALAFTFATRAAVIAGNTGGASHIRVAGYSTVGDGGGGLMVLTAGTPSAAGCTSADGYKYELANPMRYPQHYGCFPDGDADPLSAECIANTAALHAWANFAGWRHWLMTGTKFVTNRLAPTTPGMITVDDRLVWECCDDADGALRTNGLDISFVCHGGKKTGGGAQIIGKSTTLSSVVYLSGGNVLFKGIHVVCKRAGKDALYIGRNGAVRGQGLTSGLIEDCLLEGDTNCRNASSVAGASGLIYNRCAFTGAVTAPGAGLDIEANDYYDVDGVTCIDCDAFENGTYGFITAWGSRVTYVRCKAWDNDQAGFCGASGSGLLWTAGITRPEIDIIAVTAIDIGTGVVTIYDPENSVRPGRICVPSVRGAGVKPTDMTSRWTVYSKAATGSADHYDCLLTQVGYTPKVTWATPASAVYADDSTTSEIFLQMFGPGQTDTIRGYECEAWGNGGEHGQFLASTAVDVKWFDCRAESPAAEPGFYFLLTCDWGLFHSTAKGDATSATTTDIGLFASSCSDGEWGGNTIEDYSYRGLHVGSNFGKANNRLGDTILNCGTQATGAVMRLTSIADFRVGPTLLRNDGAHPVGQYGIDANTNVTGGTFEGTNIAGLADGTLTEANAMLVSASCRLRDVKHLDGTRYNGRKFTSTIDFASMALGESAGAAVGTPVTVSATGAEIGDRVHVVLATPAAGVKGNADVFSTGSLRVWATNHCGANPTDPASQTVTIYVDKP